jgi:hypothetical protein
MIPPINNCSSCQEHFGIRAEDCFDPLDLIEARDLDKGLLIPL